MSTLPRWQRKAIAKARRHQCKACLWRRGRERHHWLIHARWTHESRWRIWLREHTPTVWLCLKCHHRVSRWDARPHTPVCLVTFLVMLRGWIMTLGTVGLLGFLLLHRPF